MIPVVTFNVKKTQCICFSKSNDTGCVPVTLNNKEHKWESKMNHLYYIFNQRLDNNDDLRKKKCHLISGVNKVLANLQCAISYVRNTFVGFIVVLYGN